MIAPLNSVMSHPELKAQGKGLKQFYVTSGLGLAYENDFLVEIFSIQRPSKELLLPDYSADYLHKVIAQKKVNAKKKQENTLAGLLAKVAAQNEMATTKQKDTSIETMKQSMAAPARTFRVPYMITAMTYHSSGEERQSLAIGLVDGAILVFDLALGVEKYFIEKHPMAVTSLAFYEERILMSGSVDGRVNLCDLDSEG